MATVSLRVDPDVLISKSGEMDTKRNMISGLLDEAKNQVKSLPSTWEGSASEALQAQFNQTYDDIEKILEIIQEHSADLKAIGENFKSTTQAVESEIQGLPVDGVQ